MRDLPPGADCVSAPRWFAAASVSRNFIGQRAYVIYAVRRASAADHDDGVPSD